MRATLSAGLIGMAALVGGFVGLHGQENPRAAQPERPTVATHAGTVASGFAEIESGVEYDRFGDGSTLWNFPVIVKLGVARNVQLSLMVPFVSPPVAGFGPGDFGAGVKVRLGGGFAVFPSIKVPSGSSGNNRGTSTTDGSLLLIWSRALGPVAMDLNAGITRRSGDESIAPRTSTVWTASFGGPARGPVGWVVEWFGYPGTKGPAGSAATVALLAGPTFTITPWLVFDAGGIVGVTGPQPDALYAGLTMNLGRYVP